MKKIRNGILFLITSLCTSFIYAQENSAVTGFKNLGSLVDTFTGSIVKALITLFSTLALAAFFFGIVRFIFGLRDGKEQVITEGKKFMGWGLAALFVMFSVFGIITWGQGIFGIQGKTDIVIPQIKGLGGTNTSTNSPYTSPSSLPVGNTSTAIPCPFGQGGTYTDSYDYKYCPGYSSGSNSGGSGSSGNSVCLAYGPGTGCTTASGGPGVCSTRNTCESDNSSY